MAGPNSFSSLSRTTFANQNPLAQQMGAGILSTFLCPTGQTYLNSQFYFYVGTPATPATMAQIIADVAYIKLLVNGVQISYATGQQWVMLANYYKQNIVAQNNGLLPIFYERPWMQGLRSQRGPAYGMVGQNSFQIQVQLNAPGGTEITGMSLWHEIDPVASPLGRHVEVRTQTHTFSSTGLDRIIDLPQQDASALPNAIIALHLELLGGGGSATKADISNTVVQVENTDIINSEVNVQENKYLFATSPRTPQTGYFALDFDWRNRDDGQLWDNMNQLSINNTFTVAPGTYNVVMEILTGTPGATAGT